MNRRKLPDSRNPKKLPELHVAAHRHLLQVAKQISVNVHAAIETTGPIWFPPRSVPDLPTFLAKAIIGQQLSSKAATAIWTRISNAASSQEQPVVHWAAEAREEELRLYGVSRLKARALTGLASAMAPMDFRQETFGRLSHERRTAMLTRLTGVGPWTSAMVSIFFLNDTDVWPHGDSSAARVLANLLDLGTVTDTDLARMTAPFRPYRSILALHLWRRADERV